MAESEHFEETYGLKQHSINDNDWQDDTSITYSPKLPHWLHVKFRLAATFCSPTGKDLLRISGYNVDVTSSSLGAFFTFTWMMSGSTMAFQRLMNSTR